MEKDQCVTIQIYIELLRGDKWHRIGEWWNLGCAGEERFGFQKLNLTNSANVNLINVGYYFLLFSSAVYRLIILWSWMIIIIVDLFVIFRNLGFSQPCFIMHELAMILWLDKGDSWIYLPCCGVLIDFILITNLNTNIWEITWYSLSVVLKCIRPVFVLSDVFDKQITAQRREVFVSGDGNCFYRAVAFRRNETGSEKREEISCGSSLFSNTKTVTVSSALKFSTMVSSADLTD